MQHKHVRMMAIGDRVRLDTICGGKQFSAPVIGDDVRNAYVDLMRNVMASGASAASCRAPEMLDCCEEPSAEMFAALVKGIG